MASKSQIRSNLIAICWAAPLIALTLLIREKYGLDGLRHALPYLVGIPFGFGNLLVVRVFGRACVKATTPIGRLRNIYVAAVIIGWLVLTGLSFFQQLIKPTLWQFGASFLMLVFFIAPPFMRSRQTPPPDHTN